MRRVKAPWIKLSVGDVINTLIDRPSAKLYSVSTINDVKDQRRAKRPGD